MAELLPEVREQIEEILRQKLGTEPGLSEPELHELRDMVGRLLANTMNEGKITSNDIVSAVVAGVAAYMIYKWLKQVLR